MTNMITGQLQAATVVTNCWEQSSRLYQTVFGYDLLEEGQLSAAQKAGLTPKLGRYSLWGYNSGAVVRLVELNDSTARPGRDGARAFDPGMAIIETGTTEVQATYERAIRARFGVISLPKDYRFEGPEPLGKAVFRSFALFGPAGEQYFITQVMQRSGGESHLMRQGMQGVNAPGNVDFGLADRQPVTEFWTAIMGLVPVTDLYANQPDVAEIMGGPPGMSFDMLLMGFEKERVGLELDIYKPYHPDYDYQTYPTSFEKTGLAMATYPVADISSLAQAVERAGYEIVSRVGLPLRGRAAPSAIIVRGPVGELIELVEPG